MAPDARLRRGTNLQDASPRRWSRAFSLRRDLRAFLPPPEDRSPRWAPKNRSSLATLGAPRPEGHAALGAVDPRRDRLSAEGSDAHSGSQKGPRATSRQLRAPISSSCACLHATSRPPRRSPPVRHLTRREAWADGPYRGLSSRASLRTASPRARRRPPPEGQTPPRRSARLRRASLHAAPGSTQDASRGAEVPT